MGRSSYDVLGDEGAAPINQQPFSQTVDSLKLNAY